jgi:LCP family protein required for cell wall assembly
MKYVDLKAQRGETVAAKPKQSSRIKSLPLIVVILFLFLMSAFALLKMSNGAFDPVSIVGGVSASDMKETDGRTNILIIGVDTRTNGSETSTLSDTLIVASIGRVENDVVLISLPRDLWVQTPQGFYQKINAMYAYGGSSATQKVVEDVLGIPVHYYAVVDFNIFKDVINTVGGVEVNVENPFEDFEYPIEGKENDSCGVSKEDAEKMLEEGKSYVQIYPCRYEHFKFDAGVQTMDGETALKFARSRHGNNNEGTDFARSKRQQKIILAVKDKVMSTDTLLNPTKLKGLYDSYSNNVDTNVELSDVQGFYRLSQQFDFSNIKSIVVDDRSSAESGGLLYAPTDTSLYGGAYVLIPRAGANDFSQVHAYVQRYLFGTQ